MDAFVRAMIDFSKREVSIRFCTGRIKKSK